MKAFEEQMVTLLIIKWLNSLHGWAHINHSLLLIITIWSTWTVGKASTASSPVLHGQTVVGGWVGALIGSHTEEVLFSSRNRDKCKWISWCRRALNTPWSVHVGHLHVLIWISDTVEHRDWNWKWVMSEPEHHPQQERCRKEQFS